MRSPLYSAYLPLTLMTLFWGGNLAAGKFAVGHVSPMMLSTMRWGIAAAILLAVGLPQLRRDWHIVRRHLLLISVLGAMGFTLFNSLMYLGLNYTTAVNVSIEQTIIPMFIFAANYLLFRTRVAKEQIAGFVLTLVGVALTVTHGHLFRIAEIQVNIGDALILLAAVFAAAYAIAMRYKPRMHWMSLMVAMCVAATVLSLPFVAWEAAADRLILPDAYGWAIGAYAALFATVIAQIFYIQGLEQIGANRAGLFINLVPIFGTLLSLLLLREKFHSYHAIAMVLVFGGIALAEWGSRKLMAAQAAQTRDPLGTAFRTGKRDSNSN